MYNLNIVCFVYFVINLYDFEPQGLVYKYIGINLYDIKTHGSLINMSADKLDYPTVYSR